MYLRARRYVTPNSAGQVKCSKAVLEMAGTSDGRNLLNTSPKPKILNPINFKLFIMLNQGERLRKMLLEQGSFEKLEVAVKQWHEKRSKEEAEGGYVTKQWLMDNESYTQCLSSLHVNINGSVLDRGSNCAAVLRDCVFRQMADDAFEWARQHGKLRKNKVHGTEEADIPLREKWSSMKESGRRTEFAGKAEMEAPC